MASVDTQYRVVMEISDNQWSFCDFEFADHARNFINENIRDGQLFFIYKFCLMNTYEFLHGDNLSLVDYERK